MQLMTTFASHLYGISGFIQNVLCQQREHKGTYIICHQNISTDFMSSSFIISFQWLSFRHAISMVIRSLNFSIQYHKNVIIENIVIK